jgi:heme O synthase-like polyprenyltransferase
VKEGALALTAARSRASDFIALAKPRLNLLVVASALAGYVMAGWLQAARPHSTRSSNARPIV